MNHTKTNPQPQRADARDTPQTDRQPLDLDAIEARLDDALKPWGFLPPDDVHALIAEVRRLRTLVGLMPQPAPGGLDLTDDEADAFNAAIGKTPDPLILREALTRPIDREVFMGLPTPQPDPLDEKNHRDRTDRNGRTWSRLPDDCWTSETAARHFTLAETAHYFGPLTFTDTPQTPQEAHNRTQTAPERAALADIAQAAHKLAEAICDWLDLKENQ